MCRRFGQTNRRHRTTGADGRLGRRDSTSAIADSDAASIIGSGHSVAAIDQIGRLERKLGMQTVRIRDWGTTRRN